MWHDGDWIEDGEFGAAVEPRPRDPMDDYRDEKGNHIILVNGVPWPPKPRTSYKQRGYIKGVL
jgi:hypothetical protein